MNEFIKELLKLAEELHKSEGFNSVVAINEMERLYEIHINSISPTKEIYIIRMFDMRNWVETIPISLPTRKQAIAYCDEHTNMEAGVIYSYQKVFIGNFKV